MGTLYIVSEQLKCVIDGESINIYIDHGDDEEPTHVVYWHIDEVEEDAEVALSIANAVDMFHRAPQQIFDILKLDVIIK